MMAAWFLSVFFALNSLALQTVDSSQPANIVFTPLPMMSSQYFNMLSLAEEMVERNHSVSILTTSLIREKMSPVNHIKYEVPESNKVLDTIKRLSTDVKKSGILSYVDTIKTVLQLLPDTCYAIIRSKEAREKIMEADLIVTISMNFCGAYLADIFNKPFIVLHPGPLSIVGSFAGVPLPPSYVPIFGLETSDQIPFIKRLANFIMYTFKNFAMDAALTYSFRKLQSEFGKNQERFSTLFAKAEMYIVTVDFAYEFVHPLMPNVFMVGPITPKHAASLPTDLEQFMQGSGDFGVVVISFGSVISALNEAIMEKILAAISRLKQKFIWKIDLKKGTTIPSNLKVVDWLPQNDLLGHEKTKAFVSHLGINSASEAAYHGVPVVAACIMSDSFQNSIRFGQKAKMSKFIDIYKADAETWEETITEVINNSSYKEHAVKISKLMRSWQRTSVQKAGDTIQYAIDNGGRLPHLKSYASNLYWFQYHCIDVLIFLFAIWCSAMWLLYKGAKVLFALTCGGKKKAKVN